MKKKKTYVYSLISCYLSKTNLKNVIDNQRIKLNEERNNLQHKDVVLGEEIYRNVYKSLNLN